MPKKIFKELLEAYNDLRWSLTREMGDSHDAADIAQSSFERALKYAEANEVESPRGLLFRMARNIRIDGIRRDRRLDFASLDLEEDSASHTFIEHTELHPERFAEASQLLTQVSAAIEGLPPRCRQAFILSRQQGLSYAQVAQAMGISISQVEKYMVRSLRVCRQVLDE